MCVLGPLSQLMKLYHCQRSSEKLYDYLVWACTRLKRCDVRSLQSQCSKTINNCLVLANWYPFCMFLYHLFMPHWWLGSRLSFRVELHVYFFFLLKTVQFLKNHIVRKKKLLLIKRLCWLSYCMLFCFRPVPWKLKIMIIYCNVVKLDKCWMTQLLKCNFQQITLPGFLKTLR